MKPVLFHLGGTPVYPFFFTIMVGALLAIGVVWWLCRRERLSEVAAIDMGIIAIVASIVGSRVFHILFEYPGYYWEHPWRVFDFLAGGFVSLGAYIGTIGGWLYYFYRRKLPALQYFDVAAVACPVIVFFVRLGCLLTGCCYGRPTDFHFHLVFPPGSTAYYYYKDTPLHATQVYFMLNAVVLLGFMLWRYRHRMFPGQTVATFLIYMGVSRFLLEFLRGDTDRGIYLEWLIPGYGISTGQIVMLSFVAAGSALYAYARRRSAGTAHGDV